jgi:hypothetical protein
MFAFGQLTKAISSKAKTQANVERKIIDTIMHIEEVALKDILIRKSTNGKRHFSYAIWSCPTSENPFYWVKVMEDNGTSYVTHYNFYVYPKDFSIKYLDTTSDILIPLKQWSKQKQ